MSKRTDWVLNTMTALVAICALAMVGMRVQTLLHADPAKPRRINDAGSYARGGHSMGPAGAVVTIVEFADYQCPYCRKSDRILTAIRDRHPNDVRIVYRHFPLAIHDSAISAARAAECAALAGRFEPFHHLLFANATAIGVKRWTWFAAQAGIGDTVGFDSCMKQNGGFPQIARDRAEGEKIGRAHV